MQSDGANNDRPNNRIKLPDDGFDPTSSGIPTAVQEGRATRIENNRWTSEGNGFSVQVADHAVPVDEVDDSAGSA